MSIQMAPLSIALDSTEIAAASLWSLALYLGFSPTTERLTDRLNHWLSRVNTSPSKKASHAGIYASLLSIVPFIGLGLLCNYGVELGLGRSWALSMGILSCIGCGVYELGRRDGQSS